MICYYLLIFSELTQFRKIISINHPSVKQFRSRSGWTFCSLILSEDDMSLAGNEITNPVQPYIFGLQPSSALHFWPSTQFSLTFLAFNPVQPYIFGLQPSSALHFLAFNPVQPYIFWPSTQFSLTFFGLQPSSALHFLAFNPFQPYIFWPSTQFSLTFLAVPLAYDLF